MIPVGMIRAMGLLSLVAVAFSLALAGCTEEPDQTIIILDADETALEGATQLRIRVCDGSGGQRHDQTVFLSSVAFPLSIPINPLGGDRSRVFGFEAKLLTVEGLTLQSQRVFASFPGGQSEVIRRFDGACAAIDCPQHQTCVGGSCEAAATPGLTVDAPYAETLLACARQELCNGVDDDSDGAIDEGDDEAVMPTACGVAMGRTKIIGEWGSAAADRSRVNRVTLSGCERLGSAYMYLDGQGATGTHQPFRVLIYSSGDDGEPEELLALSGEVQVQGNTQPMWYQFSEWERPSGDLRLDSGEYWLGSFAGQPAGDGSEETLYDGTLQVDVPVGRLGEDNYLTGPAETFVWDEIRTLDREITLFIACAP